MRLSVLILTRDRRCDLIRSVAAVLPQLMPCDELLVLENGGSAACTGGLEERFPAVTVRRSDTNLGVPGGRNLLAAGARGEVLVFIDDDAVATPGLCDGLRRRFAADPELGVVALRIDDPKTGEPRSHEFPDRRKHMVDLLFQPTYFVGAGCAVRRQAFFAAGGFDASLFYSLEELDLSFRLAAHGARFLYDPELRVVHHAVGGGADGWLERIVANRWRVPVRHLPAPMAASHVLLWSGLLLWRALRHGKLAAWWAGLCSGVSGLPEALRERRPLPREVIARLRHAHGRLWF